MTTRVDISIGPVQGFVAQSRRTRDLWGSSYLLAFLSAHAMRGASRAGGKVTQPDIGEDHLYRWVAGDQSGSPPEFGTLPNHFVVEADGEPDTAGKRVAQAAEQSLNLAWQRVCRAVWERFVVDAAVIGNGTEAIWRRQVDSFWEFVWTAGPAGRGGLLAGRKRWRSHRPPAEPGDKCVLMHDLQELSGHVRARRREAQDEFWQSVREARGLDSLDLRDNERLCAIALVKRLFPKVAVDALGWQVDASHWLSTVYLAAVPWIRRVSRAAPRQAAGFADAVRRYAPNGAFPINRPQFGLEMAEAGDFARLDANYLRRGALQNEELCPLKHSASADRQALDGLLKALCEAEDENGRLGPPPSYYALVLADGDRLGELAGRVGGGEVSRALARFTARVPALADAHDGVTVYAGGDDVLCMLAMPRALEFAQALSETYRKSFTEYADLSGTDLRRATLSASVVFAQARLPLNQVLGEAHRLLDDVAKDGNGRDSLAVAVLKPSGLHCQWATTWVRRGSDGETVEAVELVRRLEGRIAGAAAEAGVSSALIYRIRDMLSRLCGWDQWRPGTWGVLAFAAEDTRNLLQAEIHHSLAARMDNGAGSRSAELTAAAWNLLGRSRNARTDAMNARSKSDQETPQAEAGIDALLLARFLAHPEEAAEQGPDE